MEANEFLDINAEMKEPDGAKGSGGDSLRKPLTQERLVLWITLALLAVITIYTLLSMNCSNINIPVAVRETFRNFKTIFMKPVSKHLTLLDAFHGIIITLGLSFLTTLIGAILAFFTGLMAARNLSPKWLAGIVKAFVAFIRGVPTILWVLIFAVAAGLGSTAAVIGMTFHTVAYLTKAYSESFEDLDLGAIEALRATGASWWQIVFQAVLPCSANYLLSWTFMRFEINFSNAIAMGAAAGAAGIGFDLSMASGFYFDLHEVGLITYFILGFAILLETFSFQWKSRLRKGA